MIGVSMLVLLIPFLSPIVVIAAIILIAGRKSEESFESKVRSIYCYIILIGCVIVLISGSILLITSVTDIFLPTTNTANNANPNYDRNSNLQKAITAVSLIIVATPTFIYHKGLVEKKKK